MEGISDIRIVGIDETRPPMITKSPYVAVYFKLSHKVPLDWGNRFNDLVSKNKYKPRLDKESRLYIDAWVRKPEEIPQMLAQLIEQVDRCNRNYIEGLKAARFAAMNTSTESIGPEQEELNRIVAGLSFETKDTSASSGGS